MATQSEQLPKVTVCMPVSRSAEAVAASLDNVLGQSFRDLEILIGDDCGHGRQVVERSGDPRIRYKRNDPALGFTANHEALLARAGGELIAFLHDDDRWDASYLERAVKALEDDPGVGLALAAHRELPGGRVSFCPPAGRYANALLLALDADVRLLPSATLVRRRALADVRRPWPPLSCGDMVIYLDIASAGWGVVVVDTPLVSYARHPEQISADANRFRRDLAALFELYRFADPEAEQIRRRRLAETWLSIARADLRSATPREARPSVAKAWAAAKSPRAAAEGIALATLSLCPPLLRLALKAWYAIRGVPPTMEGEAR